MRRTFIILTLAGLLAGCTGGTVYDHYDHTPIAGWEKVDTLTYDVPALRDSGYYVTTLGLRVNRMFPFKSLTLIVEQTVLPGRRTYVDTLNCRLVDDDGKVRGQGINFYQYRFPVSTVVLHEKDSLHITVRHDMRREIMPGVSDVGIQVEKVK